MATDAKACAAQDHVSKAEDSSLEIKVNKKPEKAGWNGEFKLYNDIYSNEKLRQENIVVLLDKSYSRI